MGDIPGQYLEDASGYRGHADRLIVAEDEAAVASALREAAAARVPFGGWVLSLEKLNRIEIGQGEATVGAGALLADLHAAAQRSGQFYPPDPTETSASLGGTIATNASGSRSFRFGSTRRWLRALRVVLADGTVREFERGQAVDFDPGTIPLADVTKNTAGYLLRPGMDWVDLLAGSDGTLGAVTSARVGLLPVPPALLGGVIFFAGDASALDAVDAWRAVPRLRMLEYFDRPSLDLLRSRFAEIPQQAAAALLIEQDLDSEEDSEIDAWLERVETAGAFGEESWFALAAADRERFRKFRHALPELVNDTVRRSGALKMNTDYAVPLARNREMLAYYRRRLEEEFPGRYVIFGHIGDAHVHINLFSEPANPAHASDLLVEFARQAVSLSGTVSAEHGLGKRKARLLELQYTPEQIEAMRAVKRRLDPLGILGQGTLFALSGKPG